MGKLSSETIDFIKKKKVIKRVRAAVIKKGIPVFSNPKEPDSIELNSDKTRKMLVFNNVEQIKALPIIKNAVKLILRDINAHAIFGTSKIRSKLTCKLNSNDAAISFMDLKNKSRIQIIGNNQLEVRLVKMQIKQ